MSKMTSQEALGFFFPLENILKHCNLTNQAFWVFQEAFIKTLSLRKPNQEKATLKWYKMS